MPFQLLGSCFETALEASQFACGSQLSLGPDGGAHACTGADAAGGSALLTFTSFSPVTGLAAGSYTSTLPIQPCASHMVQKPFDPAVAGAFFAFAFGPTLVLWLICKHLGSILSLVRRG